MLMIIFMICISRMNACLKASSPPLLSQTCQFYFYSQFYLLIFFFLNKFSLLHLSLPFSEKWSGFVGMEARNGPREISVSRLSIQQAVSYYLTTFTIPSCWYTQTHRGEHLELTRSMKNDKEHSIRLDNTRKMPENQQDWVIEEWHNP